MLSLPSPAAGSIVRRTRALYAPTCAGNNALRTPAAQIDRAPGPPVDSALRAATAPGLSLPEVVE
jgi:hypothetical protein